MKLRLTVLRLCSLAIFVTFAQTAVSAQEEVVPLHTVPGQSRKGSGTVSGRVVLPSGQFVTQRVRLVISSSTNPGATYYTNNNGAFGFSGLGEGVYTIEATGDTSLYETVTQEVSVARGMHLKVLIYLKERTTASNRKPESVVSLAELNQKVPAAAKKEFDKGSRLAYDGKVFCLNEDGVTFVIAAGDKFDILHTNKLADDDMCMATPAIVGDKLLIRTATRVYCIEKGAKLRQ